MSGKIAFCFPGQGSLESGDGPRDRGGDPGGDGRSTTRAARPRASTCGSSASTRRSRTWSRPRCSSRPSWRRASPCSRRSRARDRAGLRGRPFGRRVRGARRRSGDRDRRGDRAVRERGLAMAEAAASTGRDGGDPGARRRDRRDAVPQDPRRVAGQLHRPGQDRGAGEAPRGRRVLAREAESAGDGRTMNAEVSWACSTAARRRRAPPPVAGGEVIDFTGADPTVHVDGDRADLESAPRL